MKISKTVLVVALLAIGVLAAIAFFHLRPSGESRSIKLGAPLSTAYLYGWDAERGIRLAVEEINAAGGVDVGGEVLPFEVEVIDTRDLEPGVPVDDAIKAVERLILQRRVDFLVGGPVRSEAALAVMDLLGRYKKGSSGCSSWFRTWPTPARQARSWRSS